MKKSDVDTGFGYAWEIQDHEEAGPWGLCYWVSPSKEALEMGVGKPSPEARIVRVRIVRESDWRKL